MNNSFQWGPVGPWGGMKGLSERGWGGQASGIKERLSRRLLQAETQGKQMRKKTKKQTRSHIFQLSVVAEAATTTTNATPVPPSMPHFSGGTSEAHLAASPNKAWQGLAGLGKQLREEGDRHCHSFKACSMALPVVVHQYLTYGQT